MLYFLHVEEKLHHTSCEYYQILPSTWFFNFLFLDNAPVTILIHRKYQPAFSYGFCRFPQREFLMTLFTKDILYYQRENSAIKQPAQHRNHQLSNSFTMWVLDYRITDWVSLYNQ